MQQRIAAAMASLTPPTRAQVFLELERDPGAWSYVRPLLLSADPAREVDLDMRRAVANETAPRAHPAPRGGWEDLRRFVRETVAAAAAGERGPDPVYLAGLGQSTVTYGTGGTSVWDAIGSAVSAIGTTASSIYAQRLQAQLQAARIAAERRAQEAAAQRAAQERAAAEAAMRPPAPGAPGVPAPGAPGYRPPAREPGMPWYVWAAIVAAVLGGGFLAFRALRG